METGRYVFGQNVEEKEETPAEARMRIFHATKAEIEKRHKTAMAQLQKQQLQERNKLDADFNQEYTENSVRARLRKEQP